MNDFNAKTMRETIGHDHGLILEIGSNECEDSVQFVAEMPGCTVHAFEPDPRAIAKARAKNLPPNIHLYEVALADQVGTHEFHQSDGQPDGDYWKGYGGHWDKSGSLLPNDRHTQFTKWMSFLPPITVPTTTLDAWAAEYLDPNAEISFAWVDIQGGEAMMLRGAQETIKRLRWIICEADPRPLYKEMPRLADLDALLPGFIRQPIEYRGFNFLWQNVMLK
jgi:FkbM family methyltransferase